MQHLGAEVGQFRGFFKADHLDSQGIGADARVGGHDAVDVGPDFDGFGVQRAADQRSGKVRAAAAERGGDAGLVRADEAAHDRHAAGLHEMRTNMVRAAIFDQRVLRGWPSGTASR
jgi:hypothetical protein